MTTSVRYGSRYASRAQADPDRRCPTCSGPLPSTRARYCSVGCKQRAYRLRRVAVASADLDALTADLRHRQTLVAHTIYECPACGARFLGEQPCAECNRFCRALGPGGACPGCDEPILLADLLDLGADRPRLAQHRLDAPRPRRAFS